VSKLDPTQTITTLTDDIPWRVPDLAPPNSVAEAVLAGSEATEGANVIAVSGIAPVHQQWVDASQPVLRQWPLTAA
jgi:hypothetical protein